MPRGKHGNHAKGSKHYAWSQKILSTEGYVKVRVGRSHPLADPNGYAYEHLVVWVSAGNPAPGEGEILHHENEDREDNRLENLRLLSRGEHNAHHNAQRGRDEKGRFLPSGRQIDGETWGQFPQAAKP